MDKVFMRLTWVWVVLLAYSVSGCNSATGRTNQSSDKEVSLIRGNTRDEVVLVLGTPLREENVQIAEGHYIEFLFYPKAKEEERNEMMILGFKEGKLVSWQESYYKAIKQAQLQSSDEKMVQN